MDLLLGWWSEGACDGIESLNRLVECLRSQYFDISQLKDFNAVSAIHRFEHCNETVTPLHQRKDADFVEENSFVGDRGKQPVEVVLVDTLREEGNDTEDTASIETKILEHGGAERELDRCREAFVVFGLEETSLALLPLPDQSVVVPTILTRNRRE